MTDMQVAPHPIVAAAIARRVAAGLSIRITFNDGSPDFIGHYRSTDERDRKMAAARRTPGFASVEILA